MKIILTKLLVVIIVPMGVTMAQTQTINFDSLKAGDPPAGWTATKTGSGEPKWTPLPGTVGSYVPINGAFKSREWSMCRMCELAYETASVVLYGNCRSTLITSW